MENDCLLCKIIAGEITAVKVYEDEAVLAVMDINPVNPGHVLVMPKKHSANLEMTDAKDLSAVINSVKNIGAAIKSGLGYQGYNVVVNNDSVAGQLIPHLHFHIIPRRSDDNLRGWPQKPYETPEEMNELAEKIKDAL